MAAAAYFAAALALQVPRAVDLAVHEMAHCRLESNDGACEVVFYDNWTATATVNETSGVPHLVPYAAGYAAAIVVTLLPPVLAIYPAILRQAYSASCRSPACSRPGNGRFGSLANRSKSEEDPGEGRAPPGC